MKIKQFIMIRKFVLVDKTVTDFCCVLILMGMEVLNSVLKYCPATVIFITSNTKCCKFYDESVEEKDKRV